MTMGRVKCSARANASTNTGPPVQRALFFTLLRSGGRLRSPHRSRARHRVLDCPSREGADPRALDAGRPCFDDADLEPRWKLQLRHLARSSAVGNARIVDVEDRLLGPGDASAGRFLPTAE